MSRGQTGLISFITCILVVGLALLVLSPVPRAAALPVAYADPAHGIMQRPANGSEQFSSRNWDGYVAYNFSDSADFTTVKASWIQPTVSCEANNALTLFWVGLDGWGSGTVEQGGSEAYCFNAGGAAYYTLWWEMYPTNYVQTVLTINSGDSITASVKYVARTSTFTIEVNDTTSGQAFTENEQCASGLVCARSSADVITEDALTASGTYFPLADYGTMGYTHASMTAADSHKGPISSTGWFNGAVTEDAGGTTYASVTPLSSKGSAFNTTWQHQ